MKIASEWFTLLPEFCHKNAAAYLLRRPELKDKKFTTFREALKEGFDWRATKEGEDFWRDIYKEPEKFVMSEKKSKINIAEILGWTRCVNQQKKKIF